MFLSARSMSHNSSVFFFPSITCPVLSVQVELYWHWKLTPTWCRLWLCSRSVLHMLTDVSQHRLRQGQIPAEWSDRVRTQTSSLETNSIQAEVTWPGLRPSAQLRWSWVGLLSAYLSNYQSVLVLKSALGSAEVPSALSDCQHRSQSHGHAWNWPAVSLIYWHNPSWEDLHKGGIPMCFLYPASALQSGIQ